MVKPVAIDARGESRFRLLAGAAPLLAAVLGACAPQPEPRTVLDFMDDGFARDGVLTRCNQDRDATLNDVECANARRAAAAIALEAERARAGQLEKESEATLLALRERDARAAAAEQEQAAAVRAAADAAYEARWRPTIQIEAAPPPNDLVISSPRIEMSDLTAVPRPFRDVAAE